MNEKLEEIINGTLLGDGCVKFDNYKYTKYFCYKLTAKDRNFLKWFEIFLNNFGIKYWATIDNPTVHALYFYINTCPYPEFLNLHSKWYIPKNGRNFKIAPKDLELTPTVLLHWYLGDGSLIRARENRVPRIVFATNNFSKEDVDILIQKLKKLGLNFYSVASTSGFNKGKYSGYVLNSYTQDETLYRFFKLVGLKCPIEIENCSTGRKGRGSKEHFFRNKWPTEEDWLRILSNVQGIGKLIEVKRESLGISRSQLAGKVGCQSNSIRRIEVGIRLSSVGLLKKILEELKMEYKDLDPKLL